MVYISSFTYCESIQIEMTQQGPRNQIINPLNALTPIAIPGNYSFAVSCNIAGFDVKKEHVVKVLLLSPQDNVINDSGEIRFILPPEQEIGGAGGMQINLDMRNLVITEEGLYTTNIIFDEDLIGKYPIKVLKGVLNDN